MAVSARHRRVLYLIALAAALAALTRPGGEQDAERAVAATSLPSEIQLDIVSRRLPAPSADLFPARIWEPRDAPAVPAPASPSLPEAPLLPFTYTGKVTREGTTRIVVSQQDRLYFVGAGDILDGTYSVEAIDEHRLVLKYLPLGITQVLPFPPSSALPPSGAPPPPSAPPSPRQFVGVAGPVLVPWHPDHDE